MSCLDTPGALLPLTLMRGYANGIAAGMKPVEAEGENPVARSLGKRIDHALSGEPGAGSWRQA